jgi:hypothetical protein
MFFLLMPSGITGVTLHEIGRLWKKSLTGRGKMLRGGEMMGT